MMEEAEREILLKPVPSPDEDFGFLKSVFKGKCSKDLLAEARREEFKKETERVKRVGATDLRL